MTSHTSPHGLKLARFPRREEAACRGMGNDTFFVDRGEQVWEAKLVCFRCGIRPECLAYALANNIEEGIWGGTTPRVRRLLRRAS